MNELHKQIFELFRLLDNIDTGLDMFKDNYEGFQKYVINQVKRRWNYINEKQVNELYYKFYDELELEVEE